MPLKYVEIFGESPDSPRASDAFRLKHCRFIDQPCGKRFANGIQSGACSLVNPSVGDPVVCCPKRFYENDHAVLEEVARIAFGPTIPFLRLGQPVPSEGDFVMAFGQGYGHEVRVPYGSSGESSKFSVDWILARVGSDRKLKEFFAMELQTIDTTGNYQQQFADLANSLDPCRVEENPSRRAKGSSFNFENVNKRILPQLITKGHVLRREPLCSKGLFFVCPSAVLERILMRVGELPEYPKQTGSITFLGYGLEKPDGSDRYSLVLRKSLTTTTEQLSVAFSSPRRLPAGGVYEVAIRAALLERLG